MSTHRERREARERKAKGEGEAAVFIPKKDWENHPARFTVSPLTDLADIRHCDLKPCPRCFSLVWLGGLETMKLGELEKRTVEVHLFDDDEKAEGFFCPVCDQLLLDREGVLNHRAEQKAYDKLARDEDARGAREEDDDETGGDDHPTKGELDDDAATDDSDADKELAANEKGKASRGWEMP